MIKMVDDESKILGVEQWKLKLVWLPALVGAIFLMSINMLLMPRIDEIKQFQVDSATAKKRRRITIKKEIIYCQQMKKILRQRRVCLFKHCRAEKMFIIC